MIPPHVGIMGRSPLPKPGGALWAACITTVQGWRELCGLCCFEPGEYSVDQGLSTLSSLQTSENRRNISWATKAERKTIV